LITLVEVCFICFVDVQMILMNLTFTQQLVCCTRADIIFALHNMYIL